MKSNKSIVSRKGASGKKKVNREERDESPRRLPALVDQLQTGFVFRYITTATFTGAFSVTPGMLLDSWFIAGTATTAYQLFDFVRVKKVVVRAMAVGQQIATSVPVPFSPTCTVGVEYMGLSSGIFGGGRQKSDSALGYDDAALVSLAPDPMSQAAQFQPNGGSSFFTIRAVDQFGNPLAGAVIDVHVVLKNSGDINPAAIANPRTGMTPGNLYFGGLDGNPLATTQARSAFIPRF